ncbi:MAG: 4a-hydroxytetrahydrobiopterin dehydratase [Candidatus Omnitrophica bacterium CG11_big_fil_rev_8_21_14_0_20_64_10]|nr:MAG: 4a-hydroxytetrahydrobiopterin dehydratase [Candidatus Omnitrophica bacterium CG11_big_fil_rev_8_21_14_0_20_64_10]
MSEEAEKLTEAETAKALKTIPGWELRADSIVREYTLKDFGSALAFVNRVGELAEAADHHPDILIHRYKRVTLTLSTHSAGGLTGKDFALARQIDAA